ncbi:cytosine deaminase [Actibacterium sp. 188UL27-1]|uniref:cytosine deaminase n=1 Tax=Actibacterium sp. 188UL27-1 TaxID=2786961 RepID=UPI00195AC266|nr:cytosine deaminase [Actibacterium sp. 188UL27-1]MBM7066792.1 amidohydrolase family protein [Actibacterium sp. 188UL27-1]
MAFDLILTGAVLPDGRLGQDIGIVEGKIAQIAADLPRDGAEVMDVTGHLVTPPFVDAHFHLDATLSIAGADEVNETGTLADGIALWEEMSAAMTADDYRDRALRYFDIAVSQGLLAVRTHVDVTDANLVAAQALAEVKREVADYIDLQLVAFPQMGFFCRPDMDDSIRTVLDLGFDVVGGAPHLEQTAALGRASITALCEIAAEHDAMVDMHCDENDDPASRHIETLVHETRRLGLEGRVTGSHLTSMHSMDNFYAARLITQMAQAEMNVIVNPAVNLHLQGRYDTYPKRRGLARVPELMQAGCAVAFAQDCVMDPWYPLGRGCLLDIAYLGAHACHLIEPAGLWACFEAVTDVPAQIMELDHLGLAVGKSADLVVLEARDPAEAIRLRAPRRAVIRRGQIISQTPPAHARLTLPGRPERLDLMHAFHPAPDGP